MESTKQRTHAINESSSDFVFGFGVKGEGLIQEPSCDGHLRTDDDKKSHMNESQREQVQTSDVEEWQLLYLILPQLLHQRKVVPNFPYNKGLDVFYHSLILRAEFKKEKMT